jgi:hypothetical protein
MGPPISQRPPVPTEVERIAAAERKRAAKDIRQAAKGRLVAVSRVKRREKQQSKSENQTKVLGVQLSRAERECAHIQKQIERLSLKTKGGSAQDKFPSAAVEAQRVEKAKLDSGEKELTKDNTLPDGKPPQERAQHNKQHALRAEENALENEKELEGVVENVEERAKKEDEKKGWARWFGR